MALDVIAKRTIFGPYELRALLGRGGMGEVYRAWDPRLEREVALKILRQRSGSDPDRHERFIAEARAASALNHPNIIAVFDAAVDGATPYIVSELVEGESLRDQLRRGAMPLKRVLDLACQIADGLAEAHAAGIVHRDVKPENIMITRAGRVKILDFGLAGTGAVSGPPAAVAGDDTVTEAGLVAGTVPYMSPEQARGATTDFRTDQFSFGLVLYEMVAGRRAFLYENPVETLEAIANEEPPSLAIRAPQIPLMLRWIVERCLAKNPNDRYAVTADLHLDLRMLRDRLPETFPPPAVRSGGPRSWMTRAVPWTIGMLAALLTAALWLLGAPSSPDFSALRFSPIATESRYEGFPAWSPDSQTIAFSADVGGVLQIFTRRLSSPTAAQITRSPYDAKFPFWSADGRTLFYITLAGDRDGIWGVDAAGGAPRNIVENASRGAISPDGATFAFLRDEGEPDATGAVGLWLASADGSMQRRHAPAPLGDLRFVEATVAFSPDGRQLGLCVVPESAGLEPEARGWQFWTVPLPQGQAIRRFHGWTDTMPRVGTFTWLPDSRHVVIGVVSMGAPGSQLWMADIAKNRRWPLTRGPDSYSSPSASQGGDQVVFTKGEPDYQLVRIAVDSGRAELLEGTASNETDAAWTPLGEAFAYVTDRGGQDEIWRRSRDDSADDRPLVSQRDFPDATIMLGSPSFSPDGQLLAFQRNASRPIWPLRIWYSRVAGGPPVPLLPATREGYQGAPTWSPDGQWIAFAEWSAGRWTLVKVRVFGTESPVVIRTDGTPNAAPRWSPTGDWITWETVEGFKVVSASDGQDEKLLTTNQWLVHTWSTDGKRVYGIRETDDLRLGLFAIDPASKTERPIADLGPSSPVNNPVKGLSLSPDGQTLVTSIVRLNGDLWLMRDVRRPGGLIERLFSR